MPSHRFLRLLLVIALIATCPLLLLAQGCGSGTPQAQDTSAQSKVKPQSNATEPADSATTSRQSEPTKDDNAKETSPAKQDSSQVDAVTAAAKASAQSNNPALGPLEVLKVKIVGSWARVDMQPQDKSTDAASWLLKSSGGSWTVVDFGTSIVPADYPEAPAGVFQ